MARIVLFGATGYAGSRITAEALHRGHSVTAVARRHAALDAGVRMIIGSLYDPELVNSLTARADALACAITSGPDDEGHTLPHALPIMVAAAHSNGVRIGVVGGAGSLLLSEGGAQVITKLEAIAPPDKVRDIKLHAEFLQGLRRTPEDVDWFYLSPPTGFGANAPGERRGHYRIGSEVLLTDERGNSAISGEDYAMAFVDEIERPRHRRQRFTVAY